MTTAADTPTSWPLTFFEPLEVLRRELVRFQGLNRGYACLPARRHHAAVLLDEVAAPLDSMKRIWIPAEADVAVDDPRWPARCSGSACPHPGGYVFEPGDFRLVIGARLMEKLSAGGDPVHDSPFERLDRMPVGAVYRANLSGIPLPFDPFGDDQLVVITPDGPWWLTQEGRAGETFSIDCNPSGRTVTQTAGPPARWTITNGTLVLRATALAA